MGFRTLSLRGRIVVQVEGETEDGNSAGGANWDSGGGPARTMDR